MYDFTCCKLCGGSAQPACRLRRSTLYACTNCGGHYNDVLACEFPPSAEGGGLVFPLADEHRVSRQIAFVSRHVRLFDMRLLDVGCGTGEFLAAARQVGASIRGIDLDNSRARYAREHVECTVSERPIDNEPPRSAEVVTLWDVAEHVDFPREMFRHARRVLTPGGWLFVETPARDSLAYRLGVLSYRVSRWPSSLNVLYGADRYGHKQIFSTTQLIAMLGECGFRIAHCSRHTVLTKSLDHYVSRLVPWRHLSAVAAAALTPIKWFPLRNKIMLAAQAEMPNGSR